MKTRFTLMWFVLIIALTPISVQAQASTIPVTITIYRFIQLDCYEDFPENCPGDFYGEARIDDGDWQRSPEEIEERDFSPYWIFSEQVDATKTKIPIIIRLSDEDWGSADDDYDISTGDNDRDVNLEFDLTAGTWSGDTTTGFSTGESGNGRASIIFDVAVHTNGDFDSDGIPDGIERSGIIDADGNLHTHMVSRGSDPCRKNIAVEIDFMNGADDGHNHYPDEQAIAEAIGAFDNAPVPATPSCPFPGFPTKESGIGLIVIVGNPVPEQDLNMGFNLNNPNLTTFNAIRSANFDPLHQPYFHYSLWAHNLDASTGSSGYAPKNTKDFIVSLGSWGRRCVTDGPNDILDTLVSGDDQQGTSRGEFVIVDGGNGECESAATGDDFQENPVGPINPLIYQRGTVREQAGTFIHELGHTLGLRHGGGDESNCKPNYLSVMSYTFQLVGIPDSTLPLNIDFNNDGVPDGGFRLDYSRSVLPFLSEGVTSVPDTGLIEADGIGDSTDWTIWSADAGNTWRSASGNGPIDWNTNNVIDSNRVFVDINNLGIPGCLASGSERLSGFDDWSNITYRAVMSPGADLETPPSGPELDYDSTASIYENLYQALNTTDLSISKNAIPARIESRLLDETVDSNASTAAIAGAQMDYVISITNNGSNAAQKSRVVDTLPDGVTYISDDAGCVEDPIGTLTCDLGPLSAAETRDIRITVLIDPALVYNAGEPVTITNTANVENIAGLDLNPSNNTASVDAQVIAAADLDIVELVVVNPPSQVMVNEPVTLTLRKVITNINGPSAPIDALVTVIATAPPETTITPTEIHAIQMALGLGEQRVIEEDFTLQCDEYGHHIFTFTTEIQPLDAENLPDLTNDRAETSVDIECVIPIAIDVVPAEIRLSGNRVIPVLALDNQSGQYGLPLAFDASTIDPLSVRFGSYDVVWNATGGASETHKKGHKNRDGMMLHFRASKTGLTVSDTMACLKGVWYDADGKAYTFFGCDEVVTRD